MREHPLVPIIRFYLALAALVIVSAFAPEWGMLFLATGFGWWKGCACCFSCAVFSDDYSTDRTGTDYSIRSGSWSVSAGKLTCTSASALIREETATNSSATACYATVTTTLTSSGDIARLAIAYTDDSNYWFAEIQSGAVDGTLKLYQRSAGVNTQAGLTQTISGYSSGARTFCICYRAGTMTAITAGATIIYSTTVTISSTKSGLGTGVGSSSVSFDDFSVKHHHNDSATCLGCCGAMAPGTLDSTKTWGGSGSPAYDFGTGHCSACTEPYPEFLLATVGGVADNVCVTCNGFNGAYVCAYYGPSYIFSGTACAYTTTYPHVCSGGVTGTFHCALGGSAMTGEVSGGFNEATFLLSTNITWDQFVDGNFVCMEPPTLIGALDGGNRPCDSSAATLSAIGF